MRRGTTWVRALLAAGLLAGVVSFAAPPAQAQGSLPYTDPSANGVIGLCNRAGQSITHGNITDQPFVWTAVASVAAPTPYNEAGRTATLFAYQPRSGVAPGEWSGAMLTASSRYTNPDHPMAQATAGDDTLQDFLEAYPPQWDGLVELRMYLGAPNQPEYSLKYAATDISVTGGTWAVAQGGNVACNSGTAVSIEQMLLPPSAIDPTTTTSPGAKATTHAQGASAAGPNGVGAAGATAAGATMHFTVSGGGHDGAPWTLAGVVAAAALLTIGGLAWFRALFRRRHAPRTPGI